MTPGLRAAWQRAVTSAGTSGTICDSLSRASPKRRRRLASRALSSSFLAACKRQALAAVMVTRNCVGYAGTRPFVSLQRQQRVSEERIYIGKLGRRQMIGGRAIPFDKLWTEQVGRWMVQAQDRDQRWLVARAAMTAYLGLTRSCLFFSFFSIPRATSSIVCDGLISLVLFLISFILRHSGSSLLADRCTINTQI